MGRNDLTTYLYDANGTKLRSTLYHDGKLMTTIDYVNGFVYQDQKLDFIMGDEGRILDVGGKFIYEYQIKDHLGNVRVCFADFANNGTITVTQERSYYPFGLTMKGLEYDSAKVSTPFTYKFNENKYNGKESQEFLGVQWYNYGARFYDPQLGRWHSIDPLCELGRSWSPYSYAFNNPLKFTDPDGKWVTDISTQKTDADHMSAKDDFKSMSPQTNDQGQTDEDLPNKQNENTKEPPASRDKSAKKSEDDKNESKDATDTKKFPGVKIYIEKNRDKGFFNPFTNTIHVPGSPETNSKTQHDDELHEYGHYLQLQLFQSVLGQANGLALFLNEIAIPSIMTSPSLELHISQWYEISANNLATKFIGDSFYDTKNYRTR